MTITLSGAAAFEILTKTMLGIFSKSMQRKLDAYARTIYPEKVDAERSLYRQQVDELLSQLANKNHVHQLKPLIKAQPVPVQFFFFERYLIAASALKTCGNDRLIELPDQLGLLLFETMTQFAGSSETASQVLELFRQGKLPVEF